MWLGTGKICQRQTENPSWAQKHQWHNLEQLEFPVFPVFVVLTLLSGISDKIIYLIICSLTNCFWCIYCAPHPCLTRMHAWRWFNSTNPGREICPALFQWYRWKLISYKSATSEFVSICIIIRLQWFKQMTYFDIFKLKNNRNEMKSAFSHVNLEMFAFWRTQGSRK